MSNSIERDRAEQRERWYRAGYYKHRTLSQALDHAARARPDTAFHFHVGSQVDSTTTAEINRQGRRMAGALYAAGVRKSDVIAIQLPTRRETAVLYVAAIHAGATLLPIVHTYGPAELRFILRQSRARWFAMPDRWRNVDYLERYGQIGALPELKGVIVLGERVPERGISWNELERMATDDFTTPPQHADEVCVLLYTSGTTSAPKGVMHSHNTIRSEWEIPFFANDGPFLNPFPAGHIAGFNYLLRPMVCGVPMVLMDRWDAALAAALIERYAVRQSGGTPYFLLSLMQAAQQGGHALTSLEHYGLGATGVTPDHVMLTEQMGFHGGRSYGLTEHSTVTQFSTAMPLARRAHTDGKLQPGTEARIVDDAGDDLPAGAEGEILLRGPELFVGYTDPQLDEACFAPRGWFRTGDIGRLDSEGYLTITDRKKDIIIRGGENISSREVEEVLARHPAVVEVAVVAMPDGRYGEKVCAFVTLGSGCNLSYEEMVAHCAAAGFARHKTPERLIVAQDLPRTPSGKIKKAELRERLRSGQ